MIIELDGELDDTTALQMARQQVGQADNGPQGGPMRDLFQALAPAFGTDEVTPTMPAIPGRDVVGLGLQGTQNVQQQAQQSMQDQVMQQAQIRRQRDNAIEAEKDRAQQIRLEMQRHKNDIAQAKLRAELETGLVGTRADADVDVARRTGQIAERDARTQATQTDIALAPTPEEAREQRSVAQQTAEFGLERARYQFAEDKVFGPLEREMGLFTDEGRLEAQDLMNRRSSLELQGMATPDQMQKRHAIDLEALDLQNRERRAALNREHLSQVFLAPMLQAELSAKRQSRGQITERDIYDAAISAAQNLMRDQASGFNEMSSDEIVKSSIDTAQRIAQQIAGGGQAPAQTGSEFTGANGEVYRDNGDGTATRIR